MPIEIVARSATISDDGVYRYCLGRRLKGPNPLTLGAFMVNPSKADSAEDDPTIRRWYGFCLSLGYGALAVGNKFAQRTPDVKALSCDPIRASGPENDSHIEALMRIADLLVVGWGPLGKLHPSLRDRWKDIVRIADAVGKPLYCLGTAQDGHPRHPLMLPKDAKLVPWEAPWFPNRTPFVPQTIC